MALQSTDPIADMLTRVRNALMAGKNEIRLPSSKTKQAVAAKLHKAGYFFDVKIEKGTPRDTLVITIHAPGTNAAITEIQRVSTPGRRVYTSAREIPFVKSGRGIMLVSTSKGIMTDVEARKARLGGELICKVY
ncbi:MAG: 30S ribosomal protein S8 [Candidatus Saccharimonadales bacterium]